MITRPVRVNFPCSYVTNINFRSQLQSPQKKDGVKKEEKPREKPFLWGANPSRIIEYQGSNVIKRLDIDAIVKSKAKEDFLVYSMFDNCGSNLTVTATHKNKKAVSQHHPGCGISNDQHFDPMFIKNFQKTSMQTRLKPAVWHNSFNLNNLPLKTDILSDRVSPSVAAPAPAPEKSKSDKRKQKSHLPTPEQLDEVMHFFNAQAPALFNTSSGWTYQKATYNIVFENLKLGTRSDTLNKYVMQINLMKNAARLVLSHPQLNILRMDKSIPDGAIHVRWQVSGVPHYYVPFMLTGFTPESYVMRYIDGYSIFYVNSDGFYYRHILMNVTPLRNEYAKAICEGKLGTTIYV